MAVMKSANQRRLEKMAHTAEVEAVLQEEASWEEDGKGVKTKVARAQERDERADSKLQAKMERRAMEDRETEEMTRLVEAKVSKKVTQSEVSRRQALACMGGPKPRISKVSVLHLRQSQNRTLIEASGLDDILMAFEMANEL